MGAVRGSESFDGASLKGAEIVLDKVRLSIFQVELCFEKRLRSFPC